MFGRGGRGDRVDDTKASLIIISCPKFYRWRTLKGAKLTQKESTFFAAHCVLACVCACVCVYACVCRCVALSTTTKTFPFIWQQNCHPIFSPCLFTLSSFNYQTTEFYWYFRYQSPSLSFLINSENAKSLSLFLIFCTTDFYEEHKFKNSPVFERLPYPPLPPRDRNGWTR